MEFEFSGKKYVSVNSAIDDCEGCAFTCFDCASLDIPDCGDNRIFREVENKIVNPKNIGDDMYEIVVGNKKYVSKHATEDSCVGCAFYNRELDICEIVETNEDIDMHCADDCEPDNGKYGLIYVEADVNNQQPNNTIPIHLIQATINGIADMRFDNYSNKPKFIVSKMKSDTCITCVFKNNANTKVIEFNGYTSDIVLLHDFIVDLYNETLER